MLFHLSIDANNPRHVATILAELMGGRATPFPPVAEGSWVAHAGDARNTLVEVYPRGTRLVPGPAGTVGIAATTPDHSPVHFALATALEEADVHALARREGWVSETFSRGSKFRVIELWIEGTRLVELLTPAMQQEYLEGVRLDRWEALLADAAQAAEDLVPA